VRARDLSRLLRDGAEPIEILRSVQEVLAVRAAVLRAEAASAQTGLDATQVVVAELRVLRQLASLTMTIGRLSSQQRSAPG
jgi:hypothetical protein